METNDQNGGNELIEQQIAQNNVEIEQKRQAITAERFNLVKAQGGQSWTPTPPPKLPSKPQKTENQSRADEIHKRTYGF